MIKDQKFFICKHCGNLAGLINNAGVKIICCGAEMTELVPNTTDAAKEKHIPVVSVNNNTVTVSVGSVLHPMLKEHYIDWIYLQTDNGGQRKNLAAGHAPTAVFELVKGEKAVKAFCYCNLHGLWSVDI